MSTHGWNKLCSTGYTRWMINEKKLASCQAACSKVGYKHFRHCSCNLLLAAFHDRDHDHGHVKLFPYLELSISIWNIYLRGELDGGKKKKNNSLHVCCCTSSRCMGLFGGTGFLVGLFITCVLVIGMHTDGFQSVYARRRIKTTLTVMSKERRENLKFTAEILYIHASVSTLGVPVPDQT